MGQQCDFCGDQRSMVYCQSDNVCLCFSCDRNVHSANTISRRHSRTLICKRCNSQPAIVRCVQEKICFCQNCYWIDGYEAGPASSGHKRRREEAISCYSGCPTAAELSNIWSFDLEFPLGLEDDDTALSCEQQGSGGLMGSTNEESRVNCLINPQLNESTMDQDLEEKKMVDMEIELCFSGRKGTGILNDDFFKDFNMDDIDLSLENFEQLFGTGNLFESGDADDPDIKTHCAFASEVQSATQSQATEQGYRDQVSADSTTNYDVDRSLCGTLSFGGLSGGGGESGSGSGSGGGGDYNEDCNISTMHSPFGEPPLHSPLLLSANRENAVLRYKEKKKTRKFDNIIRYASRKARADVRKRVKGRFVKAGDPYDYDPLNQNY
ncbi:unnamed protein product [Camellia sinensis]